MRRPIAVLWTSLLLAGLLLAGPAATTVTAQVPPYERAAFACAPRGTLPDSPTTRISAVRVDLANPANSELGCAFRGTAVLTSFGGPCVYEDANVRVVFRTRILIGWSSGGALACRGGTITALRADLSITKTDAAATAMPGTTTTYEIVARNQGAIGVIGARVSDPLPAAITSATWTAVGTGGASGFSSAGSGSIDETVDLPIGASVTYTLVATIDLLARGSLTNTATITPPSGAADPNPANNSATDTDTLTPLPIPNLDAGLSPAGYLPLDLFGVTPAPIGDEQIINYTVPPFVFAGETWTRLGVDSNGYLVVNGGVAEDNNCCAIPVGPSPARPNNLLAPFWTDLDGSSTPGIFIATLTDGINDWIVVEWRVNVFGTSSERHFQVWIGINGVEDISFAYDPAALPADPAGQPFAVRAENRFGQGDDAPGLPTGDLRVTSVVPLALAIGAPAQIAGGELRLSTESVVRAAGVVSDSGK